MNIVETCTCGGSIRLVGARQSISEEVASFRDAHDVCRQRKTREERDRETNEQLVQYAKSMKQNTTPTERIDLPPTTQFVPQGCCPSCGHDTKSLETCAVTVNGVNRCGCGNSWHAT